MQDKYLRQLIRTILFEQEEYVPLYKKQDMARTLKQALNVGKGDWKRSGFGSSNTEKSLGKIFNQNDIKVISLIKKINNISYNKEIKNDTVKKGALSGVLSAIRKFLKNESGSFDLIISYWRDDNKRERYKNSLNSLKNSNISLFKEYRDVIYEFIELADKNSNKKDDFLFLIQIIYNI